MGISVSVHVKYAMSALLNDSKEVAEISGAVHKTKDECVQAFMAEVRKFHGNLPLIVFFTAFKDEYIKMLLANLVDKSVSLTVIHNHISAL